MEVNKIFCTHKKREADLAENCKKPYTKEKLHGYKQSIASKMPSMFVEVSSDKTKLLTPPLRGYGFCGAGGGGGF